MNIKPITTKRIYQEIIERFVEFICREEIKVGDKLPSERELSERFRVSRPSVREALRVMQTIGLVEIRAGGGVHMTDFNIGPFLDLFSPLFLKNKTFGLDLLELRQILEVRAAELAAQNVNPSNIGKLTEIITAMEKATRESNLEQGVATDISFHKQILELTNNIVLIKASELVNTLMEISIKDARALVLERAESPLQLFQDHKAIYDAISSKNQDLAAASMKSHLSVVRKVYNEYYRNLG